jgi:hypothetical protein
MINFLVKLANYLDTSGQTQIAAELDTITEKLAQMMLPGELYRPAADGVEVGMGDIYTKLMDIQGKLDHQTKGDTGVDPKQLVAELEPQFNQTANEIDKLQIQMPEGQWKQVKQTMQNQFENIKASTNPQEMPAMFSAAADALKWLLSTLIPAEKELAKEKPKHQPQHRQNPLVMEAQKLLNVTITGKWDQATNSAFLQAIRTNYPNYLKDNKFQGNLKDALLLLKNIGGLALLDETQNKKDDIMQPDFMKEPQASNTK